MRKSGYVIDVGKTLKQGGHQCGLRGSSSSSDHTTLGRVIDFSVHRFTMCRMVTTVPVPRGHCEMKPEKAMVKDRARRGGDSEWFRRVCLDPRVGHAVWRTWLKNLRKISSIVSISHTVSLDSPPT